MSGNLDALTRREFMRALGLGLVVSSAPALEMYADEKNQASQEANKQQIEQSPFVGHVRAFTYPCAVNGGFLIGLTDEREIPQGKRRLWKYSMESGSWKKIADLPLPYSNKFGIESEADIPSLDGPWLEATRDGQFAVLRIIQKNSNNQDFFHKEHYLFLDVRNGRWRTPIDEADLWKSSGYFLPDTHLFLMSRNYFSSENPSKKTVIFTEFDFDMQTYIDYFKLPVDRLLDARVISSSRVHENESDYQVYVLNALDIYRMAYQDVTRPGNPINILGLCKIGGVAPSIPNMFLTSDGKYLATHCYLFKLVGDTFKDRINNLENAKAVLSFEGLRDCHGWNPTGELVAFRGNVPLVGRVGKTRDWYPDGYPSPNRFEAMDAKERRDLLEYGEKFEKVPLLSIFDRDGNVIYTEREYTPWIRIPYTQWYDKDNMLIATQIKGEGFNREVKSGIKMINVRTGKKESLLEQIDFP